MKLRVALTPFSPYVPSGIPQVEEKNRQDIANAELAVKGKHQPLTGSRMRRTLGALRQWYQDEMELRKTEREIREKNDDAYMREANKKFAKECAEKDRIEEEFLAMSLRLVPDEVIKTYPLPGDRRKR